MMLHHQPDTKNCNMVNTQYRDGITEEIKKYLDGGGKIEKIEPGVSGITFTPTASDLKGLNRAEPQRKKKVIRQKLSDLQTRVYKYIKLYNTCNKQTPTKEELRLEFKFKTTQTVCNMLDILAKKGKIYLDDGNRPIRVIV